MYMHNAHFFRVLGGLFFSLRKKNCLCLCEVVFGKDGNFKDCLLLSIKRPTRVFLRFSPSVKSIHRSENSFRANVFSSSTQPNFDKKVKGSPSSAPSCEI